MQFTRRKFIGLALVAAAVCDAGGFAKDLKVFYQEFIWAHYFRPLVKWDNSNDADYARAAWIHHRAYKCYGALAARLWICIKFIPRGFLYTDTSFRCVFKEHSNAERTCSLHSLNAQITLGMSDAYNIKFTQNN